MAIKIWTKQFAKLLPNIFAKKSYFLRAFGDLQTISGAEADGNFLDLKISDTDVVIQSYNTGANVGFGTGTGSTTRFGNRKEIKSTDVQVPFDDPVAIHEGIDRFTVNDLPEQVLAERLALHAVAWAEAYDGIAGTALSDNADKVLLEPLTQAGVTKMFADAHKHFVNEGVSSSVPWVAYVNTNVYDILVDNGLATTLKNADVNVSQQTIYHFKGFVLVEVPDAKFEIDEIAYFAADNVGVAGVGIEVARTLDSEDFAGVALQAAGKLGKYIPAKNRKAILKAALIKTGIKFVYTDATGKGVEGILITVGDVEKYTDSNGVAVFGTAAGTIAYSAAHDDYVLDPSGPSAVVVAGAVTEVAGSVTPTTTSTSTTTQG